METFASYVFNEKELAEKMEVIYYLSKKVNIFFDKSIIFRAEIARLFLEYLQEDGLDKELVLTAVLLCNCKKVDNAQNLNKVHRYAIEGSIFLKTLGFEDRFCKICEEVNRYSGSNPREKESDILELIDQFGGMLLDRPERQGFGADEAMVLLEHRNLKTYKNNYLDKFKKFVVEIEKLEIVERTSMSVLRRLAKLYNQCDNLPVFMRSVIEDFQPKVNGLMDQTFKIVEKKKSIPVKEVIDVQIEKEKKVKQKNEKIEDVLLNSNKTMFSKETTLKVLKKIENRRIEMETE